MPVLPVSHLTWQVLRTVKRAEGPPTGRVLRLIPNRRTKDGTFLTTLVGQGLLARVTGTAAGPFEATYALTPLGENAAEFGECELPVETPPDEPAPAMRPKAARKRKGVGRGKK